MTHNTQFHEVTYFAVWQLNRFSQLVVKLFQSQKHFERWYVHRRKEILAIVFTYMGGIWSNKVNVESLPLGGVLKKEVTGR